MATLTEHQKTELGLMAGMMIGRGIGTACEMPPSMIIGVGLITAAESVARFFVPEEMHPKFDDTPRQRMLIQGIVSAWEERRGLRNKEWTCAELVARGFNPAHLGEYLFRLGENGMIECRPTESEEGEPVGWETLGGMEHCSEDWFKTVENLRSCLLFLTGGER